MALQDMGLVFKNLATGGNTPPLSRVKGSEFTVNGILKLRRQTPAYPPLQGTTAGFAYCRLRPQPTKNKQVLDRLAEMQSNIKSPFLE